MAARRHPDRAPPSQASDNPAQVRLINVLAAAYRARGRALEVIALSTNYKKNDQALGLYYKARKADALPRIDKLLEAISDEEHDLLDRRTAVAMHTVDQSNFFAKILAVFGILIVIGAVILGWLTIEAMKQEAIATADAENERERAIELEAAVTRATDELRAQKRGCGRRKRWRRSASSRAVSRTISIICCLSSWRDSN